MTTTQRRLGEYIDRPPDQIDSVLKAAAASPGSSPRVGEALLEAKFISPDELFRGIRAQRLDRLRSCKLFAQLPYPDLVMLSEGFEETSIDAGVQFITEGEPDPFLYVLASGRLEVFVGHPGRGDVIIATIEPGEPIGEMTYFSAGPRSASVRTLEHSHLLRISHDDLADYFEKSPTLMQSFLAVASDRLKRSNLQYQTNYHELKAARASLRHLTEFLDLSEAAKLGKGIDSLIERLVHTASTIINAERATLFLIDRDTGDLWSKVAEGEAMKEIRVPSGSGVVGWVADNGKTLVIDDAYADERFNPEVDRETGFRTRTILCSPIWSLSNEVLGVVQVINKQHSMPFTHEDRALISAFAHQAAVAVENFHLYERMVQNYRRVAVMLDISTAINRSLDLSSLIHEIVENTALVLECDRSSFFVLDNKAGELWSMEGHGVDRREIRVPVSSGLAGAVARSGDVLNIEDVYHDSRFNPEIDKRTGYRTQSMLCVPVIRRDGQVSGVIQAINKHHGAFNEEDIELMHAITAQIAVAVENTRLHEETLSTRNYLHSVQESISNCIMTLDTDYQVVTANHAAKQLLEQLGGGREESDFRRYLAEENWQWIDILEAVYRNQTGHSEFDRELNLADGTVATINVNIVPHLDAEGEFQGLVLVIEDISSERRIKSAFSHYLAPTVIDQLLEQPGEISLGGEKREMTFLFTDIADFTSMTEKTEPTRVVDLLNEYFDLTGAVVLRHGGTIDKIVGDALHVMFNAPIDQPDHAERAVRCAVELHLATEDYRARKRAEGIDLGLTRVGVNSGPALVGNFGGTARFDYTAYGDPINTAARLEGANKYLDTAICVADTTAVQCSDLPFRPVGELVLKGKQEPVLVHEPCIDDDTCRAGAEEYRAVYAQLDGVNADRSGLFAALATRFPDDPLVALHHRRCSAGATDTRVVLGGK